MNERLQNRKGTMVTVRCKYCFINGILLHYHGQWAVVVTTGGSRAEVTFNACDVETLQDNTIWLSN